MNEELQIELVSIVAYFCSSHFFTDTEIQSVIFLRGAHLGRHYRSVDFDGA